MWSPKREWVHILGRIMFRKSHDKIRDGENMGHKRVSRKRKTPLYNSSKIARPSLSILSLLFLSAAFQTLEILKLRA
ncbi:hypothetical protein VNO77_18302 [Canavalia gladiata]|uniref:Uncharacterized protein n=1 Tax=Canavalia gladiata TaxID=3824 RepID=A0AAN9QK75_CANGL